MALREILTKFGYDVDDRKLKKADQDVSRFKARLTEVSGLIAGGLVYQAVRTFVSDMIAIGSELNDTSAKLGISTDALQQWGLAAKLSGVKAGGLNTALKFLQKNTAAAVEGGGEQSKVFKQLGVNLKAADGSIRPTTELLRETGLAIAGMSDPAKRTAALIKVFGKSGADLAPMFSEGAAGLDKLLAKFEELGGGLGEDAIKLLDEAGDLTDEFSFAMLSLKSKLVTQLFPAINKGIGWIIKLVGGISRATQGTNVFTAAILTLGTVAVAQALAIYGKYLPLIAGFALLVLIVDELITLFQGGDTIIGRAIDALFGVGETALLVQSAREKWNEFFGDLSKFDGAGAKIEEVLSRVGADLVKFFVEDIPAAWDFMWQDINAAIGRHGTGMLGAIGSLMSIVGEFLITKAGEVAIGFATGMKEGIILGITSSIDSILGPFQFLTDKIKELLRKAFDWNSPAGFTKRLGVDLGLGMIQGQDQIAPEVASSAAQAFGPGMFSDWAPPEVMAQRAALPSEGGPAGASVRLDSRITVNVPAGSSEATREAAYMGTSAAMRDEREAMLAALEPQLEPA